MTYNENDILKIVKARRQSFLIRIAVSLILAAAFALVIALFPETTVVFISCAVIILCIYSIVRAFLIFRPSILFSREIRGVNIKEHEFFVSNRRLSFGARRSFSRFKPVANPNAKRRTKPPTSAIVYLSMPDGSVGYIDGLTNAQTDIYEIGDELYKYPGAKYPIIVSRDPEAQPCPICGTANKRGESSCISCGLEIIYK